MLLLLVSAAFAYESPDQEVVLEDEVNLFESIGYDSGWLPSGSPIAIAFRINSLGGAEVEMEGDSWLYWPPALTHGFTGTPETGYFAVDTEIEASIDFLIDWSGLYYEESLASTGTGFSGEAEFDPWVLPDSEREVVEIAIPGDQTELFNLDFDVFTGVSFYVLVDQRPDANASFAGVSFTSNDSVIDVEGESEVLEPPTDGTLELDVVFTALYGAALDLNLIPTFGVCIDVFGCYDVASFEVPIELADAEFERDFPTIEIDHPLPIAVVAADPCDFGEVLVGQIATCEIDVANWGDLELEGETGILGAGEFTVFPYDLYANQDHSDGLTVTFSPSIEGDQEATLILNTSDPAREVIEIPLMGSGWVEPVEEEPVTSISGEVGCGCASGRTEGGGWLALGLFGLLFTRRRG